MSDSLSSWLALREAADTAARSAALTLGLVNTLMEREPFILARSDTGRRAELSRIRPLRILDLGTGTGSNVRYLTSRLPVRQDWLVVDQDAALLAEVRERMDASSVARQAACAIETRQVNLGALDPQMFSGRDLVTASALLDLVSETWLASLADHCRSNGAAALFALTYNGQSRCSPGEPEDEAIRELMNRHQRGNDKGFGRAAGPDAADAAARAFVAVGYRVRREASDWALPPEAREMQRQLIEGWAEAAVEIAPDQSTMIHDWLKRRLAHVDAGRSRIVVGHDDLAAW